MRASSNEPKSPTGRATRTPRKFGAQATRLEAVDGSLDPLGPLGDVSFPAVSSPRDQGPTPPRKEQLPIRNVRPVSSMSQNSTNKSMMDSVDLEDDAESTSKAKVPPPVQPPTAGTEGGRRQIQPSVSIEQAAKPTFDITVGDPHKVGDLTTSHIVYQVRTKVGPLIPADL